MNPFSIAIHGGAGTILPSSMTPDKEAAYRAMLEKSVVAGHGILALGGSAIDAVQVAVEIMEDSPLFNAGKGSVYTHQGLHEMDASMMDGNGLRVGSVAGVRKIANPIKLSRLILEQSQHVFLIGEGAEAFARVHNMDWVEPEYFATDYRYAQLLQIQGSELTQLDHSEDALKKYGTVGAVALDMKGNLAAATSTGGLTNKRYGRIGDSAIIGAGTYAENGVCAVSCTGWGEFFIRGMAAYEVAALMKYKEMSIVEASNYVIDEKIARMGGDGGMIAVDSKGIIHLPFNTPGMYRAAIQESGKMEISIYG